MFVCVSSSDGDLGILAARKRGRGKEVEGEIR